MKKYICLTGFFLFLMFFGVIPTSAQTSGTSDSGTSTPALDYRYNFVLENFIENLKLGNYETAYQLVDGRFLKERSLKDLQHIAEQMDFKNLVEKKWTRIDDQMQSVSVATVEGEFTFADNQKRMITFYLILVGDGVLKIGDMIETLRIQDLAKRFPPQEKVAEMVKQNLLTVTKMIRKNRSAALYKSLSQAARNRIKLRDVRKALQVFRKNKTNIRLPKKVKFTVRENSPTLSADGLMLVQGTYRNKTSDVEFLLGYDYEDWQWKPGVFSFQAKPIAAATTPPDPGAASLSK